MLTKITTEVIKIAKLYTTWSHFCKIHDLGVWMCILKIQKSVHHRKICNYLLGVGLWKSYIFYVNILHCLNILQWAFDIFKYIIFTLYFYYIINIIFTTSKWRDKSNKNGILKYADYFEMVNGRRLWHSREVITSALGTAHFAL